MIPPSEYQYAGIRIPEHLWDPLTAYVVDHRPVGGFLRAVVGNDLFEAVRRADPESLRALPAIVMWLWWEAPGDCCGSARALEEWTDGWRAAG